MKQREIKFRAWDNVDYMSNPFSLQDIQEGKIQFTGDCIIMEFTGLIDKNGVEVYEGDYLVDRHKEDGKWKESLLEVQWCPKTLQWAVDASYKQDRGFLMNLVDYFTFDELEVRGNVYENPKNEEDENI